MDLTNAATVELCGNGPSTSGAAQPTRVAGARSPARQTDAHIFAAYRGPMDRPRPSTELVDATARLATTATASAALFAGLRRKDTLLVRVSSSYLTYQALSTLSRRWVRILRADATDDFRIQVHTALASGYVQLAALGVQPESLGLQAYVVRTRLTPPISKHLWRLETVRLGPEPPRSGIRWTAGKGVIGRCWKTGEVVLLNAEEAYGPYLDGSRDMWDAAEIKERLALSYEEFQVVGPRYSAVAAVPVRVGGMVRGCIVADVHAGAPGLDLLGDDGVQVLADVAVVVEDAMMRMPKWPYL